MGGTHPELQGAEDMLDGSAANLHRVGRICKAARIVHPTIEYATEIANQSSSIGRRLPVLSLE